MKNDIKNLQHIQQLVNTFYEQVQKDSLLGGIFMGAINDWPAHLAKMYRFWQTVLLEEHTYSGSPFPPHAKMPLTADHFNRWLSIWKATIDLYFEGEKAEEAKWRGDVMAEMFLSKIEFYKESNRKPLL
ncbi:group III truncated hemoglobin [Pedobacter polaris]|uniref:Group III truncated hemoglobin n=1 Tax=Pedobacter polaris TaxID=2571273 RepID=A0A4U1CTA4_9SPHI|nr:group III truncated hemoglobin [Pedobacter polaris]TKC12401.1 group III truncated hemoglobin [Pedobacter polaris]